MFHTAVYEGGVCKQVMLRIFAWLDSLTENCTHNCHVVKDPPPNPDIIEVLTIALRARSRPPSSPLSSSLAAAFCFVGGRYGSERVIGSLA